jgi:sortase A
MEEHHRTRPGSRSAFVLLSVERLLVAAGSAMVVWCALVIMDARLSQRAARLTLASATATPVDDVDAAPGRETPVTPDLPPPLPVTVLGSAIAELSIPRVHLSAVVLHGSDPQTLRRGPGHLEHTALPGQPGNVVIAGHRDSFFRPLQHIRLGDDIFVDTPRARLHYRVTALRVVTPREISVLEPTDSEVLTLITCYPFWVLGDAPDRFVVRALRVTAASATPINPPALSPPESGLVPAAHIGSAKTAPVLGTLTAADDDSLVRGASERVRRTYNARLIGRNEVRPEGPLAFRSCDIAIAGDLAVARCDTSSAADDREFDVWTLTLRRLNGGWALRSIMS